MPKYRNALPQLSGYLYLTDAGLETDLIFNKGIEIRELAAHTLLASPAGRAALADYFHGFFALARRHGVGFILDAPTWKAHNHWAADLGETEAGLRAANHEAVAFIADLREQSDDMPAPVVLNGVIGPIGDAYQPEWPITVAEAEAYHATQIGWLAETEADMVTALTHTQADEAAGFARAAKALDMPCVVSFTVETDGRLPTGQPLKEAIAQVDDLSGAAPAYYMVNCAHSEHFSDVLSTDKWARRIRGVRCNASRLSHAELDCCETLDDGNPAEFGDQHGQPGGPGCRG